MCQVLALRRHSVAAVLFTGLVSLVDGDELAEEMKSEWALPQTHGQSREVENSDRFVVGPDPQAAAVVASSSCS